MQLKANRVSEPVELTIEELMKLPLDAAFYVYNTGGGNPAYVEPSDIVDCNSERAADRVLLNVSCEVIDYLGGAASPMHIRTLYDV